MSRPKKSVVDLNYDFDFRSVEPLRDFVAYCVAHPTERFWQALRNWCGHKFVYVSDDPPPLDELVVPKQILEDTFYREGK